MPTRVPVVAPDGEIRQELLYDVDELAGLLGTSGRTVRRRVNAGLWPHVRRPGQQGPPRILFTAEHVRMIVAVFSTAHDYPAHEWEK